MDGADEIGDDVCGALRDCDGDGDDVDVGIVRRAGMLENTLLSIVSAHGDKDEALTVLAPVVEIFDGVSQLARRQGGCMAAWEVVVVHGGRELCPGAGSGGGPVTKVGDRLCAAQYMALLARAGTGGLRFRLNDAFWVADAVLVVVGAVGGVLRAVELVGGGHRGGKDREGCRERECGRGGGTGVHGGMDGKKRMRETGRACSVICRRARAGAWYIWTIIGYGGV